VRPQPSTQLVVHWHRIIKFNWHCTVCRRKSLTALRYTGNHHVCPLTPEVSGMFFNCVAAAVTVQDGGVAPEEYRSLMIRKRSNVHEIVGVIEKSYCMLEYCRQRHSDLPRWWNESISVRGTDGWSLGSVLNYWGKVAEPSCCHLGHRANMGIIGSWQGENYYNTGCTASASRLLRAGVHSPLELLYTSN